MNESSHNMQRYSIHEISLNLKTVHILYLQNIVQKATCSWYHPIGHLWVTDKVTWYAYMLASVNQNV